MGGLLGEVTAKVYAVDGVTSASSAARRYRWLVSRAAASPPSQSGFLRLFKLTDGEVYLDGERIDNMPAGEQLRMMRKRVQVVFQDPFSSLNPRMKDARISWPNRWSISAWCTAARI